MCLIYVPQMCCVVFLFVWFCPMIRHLWCLYKYKWLHKEYIDNQEQSLPPCRLHLGHTHLPSTCVRCSKVTFCPPAGPAPHHLRSMWMDGGRNEMSAAACFSSGCLRASCGSLSGEKISPCLAMRTLRSCAGLQRRIFNSTIFPVKIRSSGLFFVLCLNLLTARWQSFN